MPEKPSKARTLNQYLDPYPNFGRLREVGRVVRIQTAFAGEGWLITRHEDAQRLAGDPRLSVDAHHAGPELRCRLDEFKFRFADCLPETMLIMDPPAHTRLRRMVAREFTPRRVAGLAPYIEDTVHKLLAPLPPHETTDLVPVLAEPLPTMVICRLLGLSEQDATHLRPLVSALRTRAVPSPRTGRPARIWYLVATGSTATPSACARAPAPLGTASALLRVHRAQPTHGRRTPVHPALTLSRPSLTVPLIPLDIAHLERVSAPADIRVDGYARERIASCRSFVDDCLAAGRAVYGATTGFGPLVVFEGRDTPVDQCDNALAHLGAGQGPDLEAPVVRAAMLVRLHSLAQARSGVSPRVADALAAALGTPFAPAVPRLGSVGASGDLIPLSYVARALRGQGHALSDGARMPAATALEHYGLRPVELDGRDALALVNGTSLTAAAAGLAVASLQRSHRSAVLLSALLTDALGCAPAFLAPQLLTAFGHAGTARVGAELRALLDGFVPTGDRPLQEPYSIRCTPQLIGAAATAAGDAARVVHDDMNGISDNPLFFPEHDLVAHGGNFFGQPVAFAADQLSLAATQLGNLAERQLDLLIDPERNGGLPPMLAVRPGHQHALQGVQLAATAIVASMRRAATPASVQSLPTNWHNQDVVPFGTQAALTALDQARTLRLLHGSLAVALRQAVYVGSRRPTAPACNDAYEQLADVVPPIRQDRPLDEDVRRAADLLDTLGDALSTRQEEQG
ncbi:aromatic amino acid lyase [Streptomyces mirabilis]|uniref:aromatic amino acid lyase n=1 Tax=Streptomyces mirabilis TaxID=68239 RepID=UPI003326FBA2